MTINKYIHRINRFEWIFSRIKLIIYKKIFKNHNIFIKPNDLISMPYLATGFHERHISLILKHAAKKGYSNFFMDIGANIGFITIQTENSFDNVFCFEPNPISYELLKINLLYSNIRNIKVYKYGLGNKNEFKDIHIPIKNLGGAFIKGVHNSYSNETFLKKDGFKKYNSNNYIKRKIAIKNASNVFKNHFLSFKKNNLLNGSIKIDVEGMEDFIIKSIASSIPQYINCFVIFENWDQNKNLNNLKELFKSRRVKIFSVVNYKKYSKNTNIFMKLLASIFFGNIYKIEEYSFNKHKHCSDFILLIN